MPAAFYEFSVEQGSDFVTSFKILKPAGGLFNFLPANGASFWNSANTSLNFDVPEEIKLAYPENADSFGWLKNVASSGTSWVDRTFLTIRMKVKDNKGCQKLNGKRIYKAVRKTGTNEIIIQEDNTNFIVDSEIEKMIPNDKGNLVSVVEMNFKLETPVEKSLYDYITTELV